MERIANIINEWDPIGFFPMAPKDEYINEITQIYEYVSTTSELRIELLADAINQIFVKKFGIDVYTEDMQQCMLIAEKILKER